MKRLLLMLILVSLTFSCKKGEKEYKTITVTGAFALYPLANVWAEEFTNQYPDVRFNISAGGAGKGMADVLAGVVDLGMFSREITSQEKELGVWWVSVTKDAVLVTINAENPLMGQIKEKGITREELKKVFITEEIKTWGGILGSSNTDKIRLFTRSDACGAAGTFAQYLGAEGQEELNGIGVYGDPGLADAIKNDKYGIGFNNVIYIYDLKTRKKYPGLEVFPLDINEDGLINPEENVYDDIHSIVAAIGDGIYPSPPARELYFISKGKPESEIVIKFLEWVLTDGQNFITEAGYIKLSETKIQGEYQKLNADNKPL